jgi:hypothetical protein
MNLLIQPIVISIFDAMLSSLARVLPEYPLIFMYVLAFQILFLKIIFFSVT